MTKQDEMKSLRIELPEDIMKAKWCGDFERAKRLIDIRLNDGRTPQNQRTRLTVEKEILERLPLDYIYTVEEAVELVQQQIPDFTVEEVEEMMDQGAIDWIYIKGVPHLSRRFFETLLAVNPSISRRAGRVADFEDKAKTKLLNDNIKKMQEQGGVCHHIRLRAKLRIKDEVFRPGERVLEPIPVPADAVNMRNIRVIGTQPEAAAVSDASYAQRTVCFEETMTENHPFYVEYEYDCAAPYHVLDADQVPVGRRDFDVEEEMPHIRFSPTILALCEELSGDEKNPLKLARRFYDFCTTAVKYSYMREYFTLTEIPEYAALNLKGDCGVQALLFITLCRCEGIPARWQSGLYVTPLFVGMHDWAQFYVEPYGWLFADPSFGGSAYRSGNEERWNHYFGNLDPFRMESNSKFQYPVEPEKKQRRMDPYDNQAGEVEYADRGLIRSEWEYSWELLEHEEKSL